MNAAPGRRVAARPRRRTVSPVLLIGLAAVVATGVMLAAVADPVPTTGTTSAPPSQAPLTNVDLVCPAGPGDVMVANPLAQSGAGGTLTAGDGTTDRPVDFTAGTSTKVSKRGPVFLHGTDGLAPGLLAARVKKSPAPGAAECVQPSGEWWFAGVGAGGAHTSTLTLANPDPDPAVADLEIWSADGPVASADTRGIAVSGGSVLTIALEELVPLRDDAVLRVVVRQGRVAASVVDQLVVGADDPIREQLAATAPPALRQVIPAMPGKPEQPVIVIGNPGETAGRAEVRVSGAASESAPLGMDAIPLGAGEVVAVPVSAATVKLLATGEGSLVVEATTPIVAALRTVVAKDLVLLPAVAPAQGNSGAVLPAAPRRTLVIAAVDAAAPVTVHFLGGAGEAGAPWKGRIRPRQSTAVPVPTGATAVWIEVNAPHLAAVRGFGPDGASWLPVRELIVNRQVPDVRPDLRPDRDN